MQILKNKNINFKIINYLVTPLKKKEISDLLNQLKLEAKDVLRKGEKDFKTLNLSDEDLENKELIINAIINNPKILQRPIVVNKNKAVIGRPPEKILEIL